MPRDYVRSGSSHRGGNSKGSFGSALAWFLIGVIVGFIFAGMIFIRKPQGIPKQYEPHPQAQTQVQATPPAPAQPSANTSSSSQTQFDFYNMLPSKKTVGPTGNSVNTTSATTSSSTINPNAGLTPSSSAAVSNTPTPAPAPTTPSATPAPPSQWMLQVGAFKNFTQADQLKAQLILAGFSAHISDAKVNNVTYHRVWMGPYSNETKAQADQKKLLQGGFKSNLVTKTS